MYEEIFAGGELNLQHWDILSEMSKIEIYRQKE